MIAFVLGFILLIHSFISITPLLSKGIKSICTPFFSISYNGRKTELCSKVVVMT